MTVAVNVSDPPMGQELMLLPLDGATGSWDEFVTRAEGSSFCHLAGWRDILSDVLGTECLYRLATSPSGEWQGVLPLVRVKSWMFGHYLVSLPFLNYGGPLGTAAAQARLTDEALAEARRSRADLLELRTRSAPPSNLRLSHRKITVVLDLPSSAEELWQHGLPAPRRRQVRRAQEQGMECRFGADQVTPFYGVFAHNMRDLGTPVLPYRLFERIAQVFARLVVFGVVYWHGQPLAAACGFVWRDEFEITWVSSLRAHDRKMPNMLLYWSFMQEMIARGIRAFNFGRCTPGGRTHQFKHQWGGVDVPLAWAQWSPRNVTATPSPERPLFRVATAMWGRLPLAIANLLGPRLVRFLP